jgi:hypothetical protein
MGHRLKAIIGPKPTVSEFAGNWIHAELIELPQGFAMVPLTLALHEDIIELAAIEKPPPPAEFSEMSAALAFVIAHLSQRGPVGYIETDYFGGTGSQSAAVWDAGRLALGPLKQEVTRKGNAYRVTPEGEGPINQALAYMRAWHRRGMDLFDTLGLGKYRSVEQ